MLTNSVCDSLSPEDEYAADFCNANMSNTKNNLIRCNMQIWGEVKKRQLFGTTTCYWLHTPQSVVMLLELCRNTTKYATIHLRLLPFFWFDLKH